MAKRAKVRRCRVCKCTDKRACEGGCWWVARDLCSACERAQFIADVAEVVRMAMELDAARGDRWKGMPGSITLARRAATTRVRKWLAKEVARG